MGRERKREERREIGGKRGRGETVKEGRGERKNLEGMEDGAEMRK